jgi:hypothetical protein
MCDGLENEVRDGENDNTLCAGGDEALLLSFGGFSRLSLSRLSGRPATSLD